MSLRKLLIFFVSCVTIVPLSSCGGNEYVVIEGFAQGGVYAVKYRPAAGTPSRDEVTRQVDSLLQVIERTFSVYDAASALSRLNAGDTVEVNAMLAELYGFAYGFFLRSGGAVDVSCGPVFELWSAGFKTNTVPSQEMLDEVSGKCGMGRLLSPGELGDRLKPGASICSADLLREEGPAPALNFNAIAQGYSCDVISRYLHSVGVSDMMVDIGEIYCEGVNPRGEGWTIGIDNPVDGNNTPGADIRGIWSSEGLPCGIVTSGNYRKYYILDGQKYAHIIDLRTRRPVQHNLLSATVVAPTALEADALATWFMVIGEEEAVRAISGFEDVEACLITSDEVWTSPGFTLRK